MKKLIPILAVLCSPVVSFAQKEIIPVINLEQEIYLTDRTGRANPTNIIKVKPTDTIKIYLNDGTELKGLVTSTEDIDQKMFKVFGEIQNKENCGFGFVMAKDGIFAGAVVFRDTDVVYVLKYSEEAKGFVFLKTINKKNLLTSKNSTKNLLTHHKTLL